MESGSSAKIVYSFDRVIPLVELEQKHILTALTYANGNKTIAAQNLGITVKTLYNKLHQYGLMGPVKSRNEAPK